MTTTRNFSALAIALTLCLIALPKTSHAITACVSTSAELASAINGAADAADDDIRVVTGNYQLAAVSVAVRGDFILSGGGWNSTCTLRLIIGAISVNGPGGSGSFLLELQNGGAQISRVNFTNWNGVNLLDRSTGPVGGELKVDRSRFSGSGLNIGTKSLSVVVQNSVFDGHDGNGLEVSNTSSTGNQPELLLQYNTIVQPTGLNTFGMIVRSGTSNPFAPARIYNNVINGHTNDVLLRHQAYELRNNHYNTLSFLNGASLSVSSSNNLSGNPSVSTLAPFAPMTPGSPLINAGEAIAAALPSRDFAGNARLVGTRPDIGAIETTVNDSSEISVTNTSDSGVGSLRTAITTANTNPVLKTIRFNITGACPRTLTLLSPLPALTRPVIIDGYTQPGSSPNSDSRTFDGTLCVVLAGANTISNGLHFQTQMPADEMTVKGLIFYGFSSEAIRISGAGKGFVNGNLFGTGSNLIQTFADTVIRVENAPGSVIGGLSDEARNVIGLGQIAGIRLSSSSERRLVLNNFIGLGANANSSLPNAIGVLIEGGTDDLIDRNRMTDNTSHAIQIAATPVSNRIRITNNLIGLRGFGAITSGGNAGNAVRVGSGAEHVVFNNAIANGGTDGIAVLAAARRVLLTPNTFRRNAVLAIDLSPDGFNPIDLDVGQTGANDQQNTAEILSARGSASQGEVRARLSSANGTYTISLYLSNQCVAPNFAEGGDDIAQSAPISLTCATATTNCTQAVTIPVDTSLLGPGSSLLGGFVTAIVRDEENNTSELSPCEQYVLGDNIFKNGYE